MSNIFIFYFFINNFKILKVFIFIGIFKRLLNFLPLYKEIADIVKRYSIFLDFFEEIPKKIGKKKHYFSVIA